jgi:thymidylate kinase
MTARRPKLVALCGVDGVGKTTLLRALEGALPAGSTRIVGRGPAPCERLVERRFPRRFGDHRDWIAGDFARAVAVACAFDYVAFHETTVAPLLAGAGAGDGDGDGDGDGPDLVVTDRHAACFLAYALCADEPDALALELLRGVPEPDLVLHVTVPETVNRARSAPGRVERDPFEHPDCQSRLMAAYGRVFATLRAPVVEVANDGLVGHTVAAALQAIGRVTGVEAGP